MRTIDTQYSLYGSLVFLLYPNGYVQGGPIFTFLHSSRATSGFSNLNVTLLLLRCYVNLDSNSNQVFLVAPSHGHDHSRHNDSLFLKQGRMFGAVGSENKEWLLLTRTKKTGT